MPKRLHALVNGAAEPVVLERPSPEAPWQVVSTDSGTDAGPSQVEATGPGLYTVAHRGRRMRVQVVKHDPATGMVRMRINGRSYTISMQDEGARLMRVLGLEKAALKVREVKAPMPGLVLKLLVNPGDAVKKDTPLLVLEAMKMENVIRSPGDAVVSTISAVQGKAVEKGQLLVSFG